MPSALNRAFVAGGLAACLTCGCASVPKTIYTPDEIAAEMQLRVSAQMRDQIAVPFEIDDEIRQLAHDITGGQPDDRAKMHAIVEAIIGMTQFSISYDWLSNKTAKEVFRQGRGNCLAYANLFVGMAREVGLEAVYVDVVSVERHTREAEVIVNSGHVTAGVRQGPNVTVIDFTRTPEREYLGFKVIDDLEGIANYYNNQGFLYGYFTETAGRDLGFDPQEKELEMYRLALEIMPTFGRARNNLGVGLRRRGKVEEAIEQYRTAIENDPDFPDAHANLAAAYNSQGRIDEAVAELRIAADRSGPHGYFHHSLGVLLYRLKRYDEAIRAFRTAISKEASLADARFFLGQSYRELGDTARAIEEYTAALAINPNHEHARTSLDRLTGQSEGRSRN
jgi:tetratricopeptide (TPR) repeat protein